MTSWALIAITMTSVQAEISIYTAGNLLLESVEQSDARQRLETAQQVLALLSSENSLEHGIARLLLAKQLEIVNRIPEAIAQIATAKQILSELNQPVHLANAIYMHALILAINKRQYHLAVTELIQAVTILEKTQSSINQPNEAYNELFFTVNNRLGSLYLFLNQSSEALKYLKQAQQLVKITSTVKHKISLSKNLAEYYTKLGNIKLAERYLTENYQLASASGEDESLAKSLTRISRFYRGNHRYQLAIDFAIKAVEASQLTISNRLMGNAYNTLAISYEESGDDNLALVHYLNVINVLKDQPENYIIALAQHNIGETYVRVKQYDKAFTYLTEANHKFKGIGHSYYQLVNNIALAKLLVIQEKYLAATSYAIKGLAGAKQYNKQDQALTAHRILADIYQRTEQPQLAIEHHIEISAIIENEKQQLEKTLAEQQQNNNQLDVVALKQKIVDLEGSNLNLTQQKADTQSREIVLSVLSLLLFIVLCILVVFKRRKLNALSELLLKSRQHGFSGLQQLTTTSAVDHVISNEFSQFQYLVVIEIPLLAQLLKHMPVATMGQLQTNWLTSIQDKVACGIYHLNSSTLITAINISNIVQGHSESLKRRSTLDRLIDDIIRCMPSQLTDIATFYQPINIGVTQRATFNHSTMSVSSLSTLELALSALSASQFTSKENGLNNWTYLAPKANTHSSMFSGGDRNKWLKSIEANLIDTEFSQPLKMPIPWQSFNL